MNTTNPSSPDPLDRLFAEARAVPPDTGAVEYALETRVLGRIRERRSSASPAGIDFPWRLVPFFALVVVLTGVWEQQATQADSDAARLAFDPDAQTVSLWDELN